jgi:hypothetical protein
MSNGTDEIHRENGDAIEGERIACQFRKINKVDLIRGTGAHRAGRASLENAYCVITKPLRVR